METGAGTTISVREMGRRLGIKKVESYWLVHKGYFKIVQAAGRMRVDLESFEYWYAGQVKYHKVNGDPPGERLKSYSYSAAEIGKILGICESHVHAVMRKAGVESFLVDYWKRFRKEDFDRWYQNQSRYRTVEDRKRDEVIENASLSLPDIARLLDITRQEVYGILKEEAVQGMWDVIEIAGKKRVTRDSFDAWYNGQSKYLKPADRAAHPGYQPKPSYADQLRKDAMDRQRKKRKRLGLAPLNREEWLREHPLPYESRNDAYLTIEQAAILANKSEKTISRWIKEKRIPAIVLVPFEKSRIERAGFESYIEEKERKQ